MADYCASPAVLTLAIPGGPTVDLMSDQQGFRVSEVDLGYPEIREDMDLRPAGHGTIDFTRLFGARAVTINGFLISSPAGSRQAAWHVLAPFLDPGARVTLTYAIDADVSPRTMTVRAAQVAGPIDDPYMSDLSMGFKAADPLAYDATVQLGVVYPGSAPGRAYNWTPNRAYPAGGATIATLTSHGDFPVYPLLRLYGPATGPTVTETLPGVPARQIAFQAGFVISAGTWVEVDCRARTVLLNGDRTNSVYGNLAPSSAGWPVLPPGVATNWAYQATGLGTGSQLQVSWSDAFLI